MESGETRYRTGSAVFIELAPSGRYQNKSFDPALGMAERYVATTVYLQNGPYLDP